MKFLLAEKVAEELKMRFWRFAMIGVEIAFAMTVRTGMDCRATLAMTVKARRDCHGRVAPSQ